MVADYAPEERAPGVMQWANVAMVSYPVIRDGLIYVLDGTNGVFVLRYSGPYADELMGPGRREGNSNLPR